MNTIKEIIESVGFETLGEVSPENFTIHQEVRDMCASNQCGRYDTSWACPPACGSVEEYQEKVKQYKYGFVFQTVTKMEDDFDFEAIKEGGELHAKRFNKLVDLITDTDLDVMALSAGSCERCSECTYPDDPCRFPEKVFPSMEACGLMVGEVCKAAGIPYYHGPQTLAYCSAVLYN